MNKADRKDFEANYEKSEEHFDDPAMYWGSVGNHHRANAIRARRRKIEDGDIPEPEEE